MKYNNEKQTLQFRFLKSGWHSASYIDDSNNKSTIKLNEGINQIEFSCEDPLTPSVDFVRLTRNEFSSDIQEEAYTAYLNEVRTKSSGNSTKFPSDTTGSVTLKSATYTASPDDPLYDYDYHLDAPFKYTYYTTVSLNAGQQVFFATTSNSFYHVMEVFSSSNTQSDSWTVESDASGSASLNITVPSTGSYYIRVRSYWQNDVGLVDLNINGQYYYTDCVAAGSAGFRSWHQANQVYNYFTCNSNGDTRIWIEDNTAVPGRIIGYNDDYSGSGDFYWGLNSRIKKNFNTIIGAVLISSYSSYTPEGTTDLYIRCKNGNIMSYFPNLKADDAIMSSGASSTYNCTAWAGGFTSFWFWGSSPGYYNYGNPQVWSTWDDYFGNNPERYAGATTYTTVNANATNATVAMWAKSNGEITHGSVRKPGNENAHGYDWESKPGSLARTFHPRDALAGYDYGSIVRYYRIVTPPGSPDMTRNAGGLTFEESVNRGLTVIENVELSSSDRDLISAKKMSLNSNSSMMSTLYNNWVAEIKSDKYKIISNPYKLIENQEGDLLLNYAKNNLEEAVIYFTDIIFDKNKDKAFEQNITYYLFCELAKEKYGALIEDIKKEWKDKPYTSDGKYIAPLPETFTKKYVKAILLKL